MTYQFSLVFCFVTETTHLYWIVYELKIYMYYSDWLNVHRAEEDAQVARELQALQQLEAQKVRSSHHSPPAHPTNFSSQVIINLTIFINIYTFFLQLFCAHLHSINRTRLLAHNKLLSSWAHKTTGIAITGSVP